MTKYLILEFDDLNPHPEVDCVHLLEEFVDKYPTIHLNMFTVGCYQNTLLFDHPDWCRRVKRLIDSGNMSLAVHGYFHTAEEFKKLTYDQANYRILTAENTFKAAGLPFLKVFRGPHWGINTDTFKALIERGYTHVYSHESYKELNNQFVDKIKVIYYNWNGKDELTNPADLCVGHFHTHDVCGNGIRESFSRICKAVEGYDFEYLRVDQAT